MQVRAYRPSDAAACAQIFHQGVQIGAADAYAQAQRDAWSPHVPRPEAWTKRLSGLTIWVAEISGGVIGFIAMTPEGLVDFLFVRPDRIGQGVAAALYETLEDHARQEQLSELTTEASHMSKPFFAARGWSVVRANLAMRRGVALDNWIMSKSLANDQQ